MNYVLGFIFDLYSSKVLLIRKEKPNWQKGFFNGVGGKIEETDETIYIAMARECKEETGAFTHHLDWRKFCTMEGRNCPDGDWNVHCFSYFIPMPDMKYSFFTIEEEMVVWKDLNVINTTDLKLLGNIPWLIGMALDHRSNGNFEPPIISYSGGFSLPLSIKL